MKYGLTTRITIVIFIVLLSIYLIFDYYTGINGDDIEGFITDYVAQDCEFVDEVRLGTSEIYLFQCDPNRLGYAVFEQMALINRYHLDRLSFVDLNDLDYADELKTVDGGWHRYKVQITSDQVIVKEINRADGRYVDGLKIVALTFLISVLLTIIIHFLHKQLHK